MPRGSGRRPKPTAKKILEGNRGKRKLNDKEPAPAKGEPEMPEGLSELAISKWKSLVPKLLKLGVLTEVDGDALASLCIAYSHARLAEEGIQKLGLTVEEPVLDKQTGKVVGYKYKDNPDLRHWNDAAKIMQRFEVEFGLTPASRSRLKVEDGEEKKDPADQYFGTNVRSIRPSQSVCS